MPLGFLAASGRLPEAAQPDFIAAAAGFQRLFCLFAYALMTLKPLPYTPSARLCDTKAQGSISCIMRRIFTCSDLCTMVISTFIS